MLYRILVSRTLRTAALALLVILTVAATADARWYGLHGHAGEVEFPEYLADTHIHRPWGMNIIPYQSNSTTVHYALPTITAKKGVRYIKLVVAAGTDSEVEKVEVYNGDNMIDEFTFNYSGSKTTLAINLGKVRRFGQGLGLSIKCAAGTSADNKDRQVSIFAVRANFVNM